MRLSLELLLLKPKFALLLLGIFIAPVEVEVDEEEPFGLVDPSKILVLNIVYHIDIPIHHLQIRCQELSFSYCLSRSFPVKGKGGT